MAQIDTATITWETRHLTPAEWQSIVKGPGKFEGNCVYALAFYDLSLNGGADDTYYPPEGTGPSTDYFVLQPEDVKRFGFDDGTVAVSLYESEQGFIYMHVFDAADWQAEQESLEALYAEQEDADYE